MSNLMEVKVFQRYNEQACVTTLNFLFTGTTAAVSKSFAAVAALGFVAGITPEVGDLFGNWKAAVSSELIFTEILARDVYSTTDFYTLPLSTDNAGSQTGEAMTNFSALAVQTNRVRADIRRGSKRLAGATEGMTEEFGVLTAAQLNLMGNLCGDLSSVVTYDDEGNTLSFTPVVVSKELYTPTSGKPAYRYYETFLLQEPHLAIGVLWSAKMTLTSQNSRK